MECILACSEKHFFSARILLFLSELCIPLNSNQTKFQLIPINSVEWPSILMICHIIHMYAAVADLNFAFIAGLKPVPSFRKLNSDQF